MKGSIVMRVPAQTIHNTDPATLRTCRGCGEAKPLTAYYTTYLKGWSHVCKICQQVRNKAATKLKVADIIASGQNVECIGCKERKPPSQFTNVRNRYCKACRVIQEQSRTRKNRKAGLCVTCSRTADAGKSRCRECFDRFNQRNVEVRERRKREAIAYMGGQCVDCEERTEFICVYDFHHLDSELKEAEVASLLNGRKPMSEVKLELDKCVLLCCWCHRIRHFLMHRESTKQRTETLVAS